MALDPAGNQRPFSPAGASSGRASPVPIALPRRPLEDGPKVDKNYRRYASGVERALAQFDTTQQEWADYISFLGRLLKALQAHPPEARVIPHSATVATRLAQCLNPGLPSGVHQKAIEVYAHIFATLGKDALAVDLQLYFSGLSSVLSFASLSVRPAFLSLVEAYCLPLDPQAIRPALKAIILALLPGLEDETSEDFDRILKLLNQFRRSTYAIHAGDEEKSTVENDAYFWQCLFLATITNPSRRQGALAFLARSMPKLSTPSSKLGDRDSTNALLEEAQALVSPEPGLLIRCFAAGLGDSQLLIQRGFLDLLVTHLPLHSAVLQKLAPAADLERLVIAAASVVNRRDMSLNRRLWAWFLGPEPKGVDDVKSPTGDISSHHAAYFSEFGSRFLAASILKIIKLGGKSPSERARPFRICLSLMDRWEVGGLLVPEIFIPALESVYDYSLTATKEQTEEVVRSASIFFDGVESGLIWSKLLELVTASFKDKALPYPERLRKLRLYHFVISRFNVREEEMLAYHVPTSLLALLAFTYRKSSIRFDSAQQQTELLDQTFQICESLISLIPARVLSTRGSGIVNGEQQAELNEATVVQVAEKIQAFYEYNHGSADVEHMPFKTQAVQHYLLLLTAMDFLASLTSPTQLDSPTRLFVQVIQKVFIPQDLLEQLALYDSMLDRLQTKSVDTPIPFPVVSAITTVVAALRHSQHDQTNLYSEIVSDLSTALVQAIWPHLNPSNPKYHVEAVRCLWTIQTISSPARHVESALTLLLDESATPDACQQLATIWSLTVQEKNGPNDRIRGGMSRRVSGMPGLPVGSTAVLDHEAMLAQPLLSLLDSLADDNTELSVFVVTWLQELPSLGKVFSVLTGRLCGLQCVQRATEPSTLSNSKNPVIARQDDSQECLYYLQHVANILKHASDHTWLVVAGDTVPGFEKDAKGNAQEIVLQNLLVQICMRVLDVSSRSIEAKDTGVVHRVALSILRNILQGPFAAPLKELDLEVSLLERLQRSLEGMNPLLQSSLLETVLAALKLQLSINTTPQPVVPESPSHLRRYSKDAGRISLPRLSVTHDSRPAPRIRMPPPQLVSCLRAGFSSKSSRPVLDSWVDFFVEVLPLFADSIFQSLIPLVENFCAQIGVLYDLLTSTFENATPQDSAPESSLISLMNGLEHILAQGHERLLQEEAQSAQSKSPEQPQSFFGNMVGVFAPEQQQISRSASANNRLTVLLCFQDTVRVCFRLWSWGVQATQDPSSAASFAHTSLRVRNRARRLLEHLFAAEALECLETLCVLWCRPPTSALDTESVMSLLNVLNGSKPKNTIPAIFNALYSRTNPSALDPQRMSSLTSDLSDIEIMAFLLNYLRSLEDDSMDEIWTDCITFLRDVLANPMPHRQVLPALLEFTTILAEKVDNTNFGEERKMRRELGDLFLRLLTATFTTRSLNLSQDAFKSAVNSGGALPQQLARLSDVVAMLSTIVPRMSLVLGDNDRVVAAANSISTSVLGPAIHSKNFPANVSPDILSLLRHICQIPQAAKAWRKDVSDAFNDARFFNSRRDLVKTYWLPVVQRLNTSDKERMSELLSRLAPPSTAGIMFGVGATSARQEADRRTQLNLQRITTLILACAEDTFVSIIALIAEKVSELLTATPVTSPSSATRAELFLLLRTLILKVSPVHLTPLWPIVNAELGAALASALPDAEEADRYDASSLLQACKLLDVLVTVAPDDFQLYEWLFVTDTIDAVYKPPSWTSAALVDEVADGLRSLAAGPDEAYSFSQSVSHASAASASAPATEGLRLPFLDSSLAGVRDDVREFKRDELVRRVVKPFFGQLSILAFEATYGMQGPDLEACRDGVLNDLFDAGA